MTNLDQNMQTILETLKQKAANTSSIAELERLVLKTSQDFARTAFESLASTQPASDSFWPHTSTCLDPNHAPSCPLQQHLTGFLIPNQPLSGLDRLRR